jgi:glycosyltransferase involved in cell wall biosynthesis
VKHGETGFCLPLSAGGNEYADLIQATLQNPETYRRLSLGAFAEYQQALNWDSAAHSLLDLVQRASALSKA